MRTSNRAIRVNEDGMNTGRWTKDEHDAFLNGLLLHGRDWKKVVAMIPTRSSAQIRSHAQKYFGKLQREMGLKPLDGVDESNVRSSTNNFKDMMSYERIDTLRGIEQEIINLCDMRNHYRESFRLIELDEKIKVLFYSISSETESTSEWAKGILQNIVTSMKPNLTHHGKELIDCFSKWSSQSTGALNLARNLTRKKRQKKVGPVLGGSPVTVLVDNSPIFPVIYQVKQMKTKPAVSHAHAERDIVSHDKLTALQVLTMVAVGSATCDDSHTLKNSYKKRKREI